MSSNKALVVIDIQKEYNTAGRPFFIEGIADSLERGASLLAQARQASWPIIHVQHLQDEGIFKRGSELAEFIEGFEPQDGEKVIEKGNFSCFSAPAFTQELEKFVDHEIIVIGYNSTMCVLSTVIDGYHRGFKMTVVKDATAAKAGPRFDSAHTHEVMLDTLASFCNISTSQDI